MKDTTVSIGHTSPSIKTSLTRRKLTSSSANSNILLDNKRIDPRLNWVTAFPDAKQESSSSFYPLVIEPPNDDELLPVEEASKPINPAVKPFVSWNNKPLAPIQASHPTNDIASPTPPTIWNIDRPEEGKGQTPPSKAPYPQKEWHFFSPNSSPAAVSHATAPNDADASSSAEDSVSDFSDYLWHYNADKMEIHPCDHDDRSSSRSRGRVCTHDMLILTFEIF